MKGGDKLAKTRLKDMEIMEGTICARGKNSLAKVVLFKMDDINKEIPMKTENGIQHPASHFAFVPDKEKPSTWKLRLFDDNGEMTPKQIGMAVAALGAGFRGQKVDIPAEDLPKVKAKVRAAWKKVNPDAEEVPTVLKSMSFVEMIKSNISNFWNSIHKNMDIAMTVDEMFEVSDARDKWWKLSCAFEQSIISILQDETADQSSMLTESCMQFINRAKQLAPYLQDMYKSDMNQINGVFAAIESISEDVSKAGKKISSSNMEKLKQAMDALKEIMGMPMLDEDEDMQMKRCKPKSEMKKSDIDYKNQQEGDGQTMTFQDLFKSLTPEQQKMFQDEIAKQAQEAINKSQPDNEIKKQLDEVSKANVELAKALEAERDLRITKEFIAKAETYKSLPVKADDFGKMLKDICKKAPEQYEELVKVLDAANNLINKNNKLMDEIGGGQPVENDALVKMNAKAAEIQKSHSGMTFEVAFAKACNEDPQLYNEYLNQI